MYINRQPDGCNDVSMLVPLKLSQGYSNIYFATKFPAMYHHVDKQISCIKCCSEEKSIKHRSLIKLVHLYEICEISQQKQT